MLAKISEFFKLRKSLLLLVIVVFLFCLLSFGLGMITQFYLAKPVLQIEQAQ